MMQEARCALREAYKHLDAAQPETENVPEVAEAIKKLKSDCLFLMGILAEAEGCVIHFPKAARAN
jgi:hypothetical protein